MRKNTLLIKSIVIAVMVLAFLSIFSDQQYVQWMLSYKYLTYLIVVIAAIALLAMKKVSNILRIISLIILFFIFGVFVDIHPSPLCALTKSFTRYQIRGFVPSAMIIMAGAMVLFSVVGNKAFCGWICPLGCLQEVVFRLSSRIKKFKLPFHITNSFRISIFVIFLIFVFSFDINIYNLFNPFELFHWKIDNYIIAVLAVVILASLFYFRPFCQFLCPAGLFTWIFEHVSLFKIHKNEEKCTHCNQCVKESPCEAIGSIMNDKKIIPDCFPCGECIRICPEDALSFSLYQKPTIKKDP